MMIWSLCSVVGLWIAHRTMNDCERLQLFAQEKMNHVRVFIFLTVIALNFFLKDFVSCLIAFNIVIILSPLYLPLFIEKQREKLLKSQFIPILDHLILSMRSGKGFRPSILSCADRNSKPIRYALLEFFSAIQYQKEIKSLSRDPKIVFFFQELGQVDQSAHKPVERLKSLRRRLMIEKNFRLKSRQALLQVRFQSWIITAMYVLVLLYVQYDFGFKKNLSLILFSGFLFSAGLLCVQRMGRSYQWKI